MLLAVRPRKGLLVAASARKLVLAESGATRELLYCRTSNGRVTRLAVLIKKVLREARGSGVGRRRARNGFLYARRTGHFRNLRRRRPATPPGPGTDSDGTGTGHPRQAPPSGDLPPSGSLTNPPPPDLARDTKTSATTPRTGNVPRGSWSGQAADPQAAAGLDSKFGCRRIGVEQSFEFDACFGRCGIKPGLDGGRCILINQRSSEFDFGYDAGSNTSRAKGSPDGPGYKSRISDGPSKTIDVPFEIGCLSADGV